MYGAPLNTFDEASTALYRMGESNRHDVTLIAMKLKIQTEGRRICRLDVSSA